MVRNIFCLVSVLIFLISCTNSGKAYTKFLNKDSLPSQFVTIDNKRDTTVVQVIQCLEEG